MYKYKNNLLPSAFVSYFPTPEHAYPTRSNSEYTSTYPRTNTRKFSIKYQGPLLWNKLPGSLKTAKSLPHFKQLVRAHVAKKIENDVSR